MGPKAKGSGSKSSSHQTLSEVLPSNSSLFKFSPSSTSFAIINPSSPSPVLRVYSTSASTSTSSEKDSTSSSLISSYLIPSGTKPTSLTWLTISSDSNSPSKKRRKSSSNNQKPSSLVNEELILLSLSTSSILIYSPLTSSVKLVLKDQDSISTSKNQVSCDSNYVYSTSDGIIRAWKLKSLQNQLATPASTSQKTISPDLKFTPDSNQKVTKSIGYPITTSDSTFNPILSSHHSIFLHSNLNLVGGEPLAKFTGHSTQVSHLNWLPSSFNSSGRGIFRFLSAGENDRILTIWQTEVDLSSSKKKPINGQSKFNISLDSDVKDVDVLFDEEETLLSIVTKAGQLLLYEIPRIGEAEKNSTPETLKAICVLTVLPTQKSNVGDALPITSAMLVASGKEGKKEVKAKIVRSPKGLEGDAGIVADEILIRSASATSFPPTLNIVRAPLNPSLQASTSTSSGVSATQRYTDPTSISGHTSGSAGVGTGEVELGALLGGLPKGNGKTDLEDLEIDMDEPTLSHRLGEMKVKKSKKTSSSEDGTDSSEEEGEGSGPSAPQTSATLTSTLLQALHTSDTSLLSSILTKGSPTLIRPTILRLPSSAALPLLEACLERLARGGSNSRSKGSLGTREAKSVINWIRETLLIHMASLMAIPGLINRLANLYGVLNKRLEGKDKVVALEGRMALVVGQIQVRKGYEESIGKGLKKKKAGDKGGKVWREDSESEEDQEGMEVDGDESDDESDQEEIGAGEELGEIEDVQLSFSKNKGSNGRLNGDEDEDEEDSEEEVIQRKRKVGKSKKDKMEIDEEDESDDEEEDDDDIDEDESLMDEDEDDIEESEDESDEEGKGGPKGMFDVEAEETDGEESEGEESD